MYALALVAVILCILFKILNVNNSPEKSIFYCANQNFLEEFLKRAPALAEPYVPTRFWGFSGHVQTIIQGVISRLNCPLVNGRRVPIKLTDGATVTYDVYHPVEKHPIMGDFTLAICPGIGNNSESVYIRRVVYNAQKNGYRVAVLNHIGTLKTVPVTSPRIFGYGNTSDYAAMIKDVVRRYKSTRIICIGFSMGGNLVTKYLGELKERPANIISGVSVCQGYDAARSINYLLEWSGFRRLYLFAMTENMKSILRHWHKVLFPESIKKKYGFRVNDVFQAATLQELDDVYSRHIAGCKSVNEFYMTSSCVHSLKTINVPMVFVNAMDDPIVPPPLLEIVRDFALNHKNIIYVEQKYGGHLGFYEGGLFYPKPLTWMDRMVVHISNGLVAAFDNKDKEMYEDCSDGETTIRENCNKRDGDETNLSIKHIDNHITEAKEDLRNEDEMALNLVLSDLNLSLHGKNLSLDGSVPSSPDTSLPATPACLTPPNTPVPYSRKQARLPSGLNIFPQ